MRSIDIVKELIKIGANVNQVDNYKSTVLMYAAQKGILEIVIALLTDISNKDAEQIRNNFTDLLVLNRIRVMPKDMRTLISKKIIQELIQERLDRANLMMMVKNPKNQTAQALSRKHSIAALLDPNNKDSQEQLRKIIGNNIRRILFGEPKKKEITIEIEDPFGTWDKR